VIDTRPQSWPDFYAAVGICVIEYQIVEDMIAAIFVAASGIDGGRARAIYNVFRGIEKRLEAVSAAIVDSPVDIQNHWAGLSKRISAAASFRNNEVAHAQPVLRGGGIAIDFGTENRSPSARKLGPDRIELHKELKGKVNIVTVERLKAEYNNLQNIEADILALVQKIHGTA
jgi:hypothetical protein